MNCKHCQAELEEGSVICPECGADNAGAEEEAAAAPAVEAEKETAAVEIEEETAPEETPEAAPAAQPELSAPIQEGVKATPGKLALAVAAVLVLIAVFVALIAGGLGVFDSADATDPTEITDATDATGATEETVPATTPADTGLNDPTCKGTYTVSDEDAAAAKDTVVATLGDKELTNGQLQAYYWMQVRIFLSNNVYYLSMLGLDYTQPLDTQILDAEIAGYIGSDLADVTWQQYFLREALNAWQTYGSLVCAAEAAGFEMSDEDKEYLAAMDDTLESDAENNGFESVDAMVLYLLGAGCDAEDYKAYEEMYYRSYTYYRDNSEKVNAMTFTDEELAAFFDENASEYEALGLTKDMYTVDVRHILIMPEGADSSTIRTETFPQEAWDASKAKAEDILKQWLDGEKTEESFALLANEHSQDGTDTDYDGVADSGGLYEGVTTGEMVANFDAWCFDESRQVGDYDIVETEFGYHIMYFCGSDYLWPVYAESDLRTQLTNQPIADAAAAYPMEVDYKSIVLGFVDLTK